MPSLVNGSFWPQDYVIKPFVASPPELNGDFSAFWAQGNAVEAYTPSLAELNADAPLFQPSPKVAQLSPPPSSSTCSSLQGVACRTMPGLALPLEVVHESFSFVPCGSLPSAALVCSNWSRLVRRVIQIHKQTAEKYTQQGLDLMTTSTAPWDSLKLFRRAIATYPRLCEAYFLEAKALFVLRDTAAAIRTLERALLRGPTPVESCKLRGCLYYAQKDDNLASEMFEAARMLAPTDASIYFELGFCYHGLRKFWQAIDFYGTAIELNYPRRFVVLANRGQCLFYADQLHEALRDLNASLEINPHYECALKTRACVHLQLGNPDAAHQDYTVVIEHATEPGVRAKAYFNRAFCYDDDDEDDIELAFQEDPSNLEIQQYKAAVLMDKGCVPEAIAEVSTWLDSNQDHTNRAGMYTFRAELHGAILDWQASTWDYQTAIDLLISKMASSPDPDMSLNLETCYGRLNELKGAMRYGS